MKKLNMFRKFDWDSFSTDKIFACTGVRYSEQKKMVVADVVILNDDTDYGDKTVSNRFEKFHVSIPGSFDANQYVDLVNAQVEISNVEKVSVFGEFSNQLSLIATLSLVK